MSTAELQPTNTQSPTVPGPEGFSDQVEPIELIPLEEIFSDASWNCRGKLQQSDYIETAKSMAKIGLIQSITVQPWTDPKQPKVKYRIVVGHCRYAAAKFLKWPAIQAVVREFSPDDAFYANVMENLNRVQLNLKQEAHLVSIMAKRGMTLAAIGEKLDKSTQWVTIRIKFSEAPEKLRDELAVGQFSAKELFQILKLISVPRQYAMLRAIKEKKERAESALENTYDELAESFRKKMAEKKVRSGTEIRKMKEAIYEAFGPSLMTRILAWADGSISTNEVWDDIEVEAEKEGAVVKRPTDQRDVSIRSDIV